MERKVATVLFVDLVDSTGLVSGADPEIVRQRVNRYFEVVSRCIVTHGGTVEKFAGDAVMAAFGVPRAHEDDAERALCAALMILPEVSELGLSVRIGVESGEVVVEDADSTFATGEAVNLAARLQQAAPENTILVGPGLMRLAAGRVVVEQVDPVRVSLRSDPLPAWRVLEVAAPRAVPTAPFVGREVELELLHNTLSRAIRDRRAHLVTIFGEPGIGKSRLMREFVEGVERATVLRGRCLPFGEGVTYWALAEMVKQSAGIADDDPIAEAFEKLRACCESDAIADLLAAAAGLLGASEREHTTEELLWAARAWAEEFSLMQPLVLVFEDIHWAEEPLLNVIEHLARTVRDAPLLVVCVTRPELLELRPAWGGGNLRAAAVELAPLSDEESEQLADELLREGALSPEQRKLVLTKAEGNPLFLEETVRMLAERGGRGDDIPDTIQALIAARIDSLLPEEKHLLQRAAVIGRIFWQGALEQLAPGLDVPPLLEALVERELVVAEERSTISGERAFRFKHVLIGEVAYGGLTKAVRSELHEGFARWLHDRTGEELLEIRAYHLERAVALHEELDGRAPEELCHSAAAALEGAGKRALNREAFQTARHKFLRAIELESTLRRRYLAAHSAWRMLDLQAVTVEMEQVAADAGAAGERRLEARALTALGEMALFQHADVEAARRLIERAGAVLGGDDDVDAHFDIYSAAGQIASWLGDFDEMERIAREALDYTRGADRKDLEAMVIQSLAQYAIMRLDVPEAESLGRQASELAAASGSVRARAAALGTQAWIEEIGGRLDDARRCYGELLRLYSDIGNIAGAGATQIYYGRLLLHAGDAAGSETMLREAVRALTRVGDRGHLCEAQRFLAQTLAARGKIDEAERIALQAVETVGPDDQLSVWTTRMALGVVRAAQGRDDEAEHLIRDAVDAFVDSGLRFAELQALDELMKFLRARGRNEEAQAYEERARVLMLGTPAKRTERIA
jgi:class 3 adenylate cyclase/tetratricopeptide (TPR) repeat protein